MIREENPMPAVKTRTVPALYNALSILELLTDSHSGLTLPELVEKSSLAKSSVHYLLVTLERCGYVLRNERTGRYLLGVKLFCMANSAINSLGLRQRAAPYLSGLRLRTGLTVHLAILEQNEAVLVVKLGNVRGAQLASWVGKRMDLHCTAVGKAIFAFLPGAEVDVIIRERGLARHNGNTVATAQCLRQELDRIAKTGYAFDNEEDELGVCCIGVPIFGPTGRPVAAISVAGTTTEISSKNLPRLSGDLFHTATMIGRDALDLMPGRLVDCVAS